jgi:benzoyl-CoA reductase subunit B
MNAVAPPQIKANRLSTAALNNKLVNDYWTGVFNAKREGRLICWYEGVAINPLMQAADISWVHGEAWAALLAARKNEIKPQAAAENRGYLKELCSYARTHIGCGVMAQRREEQDTGSSFAAALADGALAERVPAPDMFISAYPYCSTGQQWDEMLYPAVRQEDPGLQHLHSLGLGQQAGLDLPRRHRVQGRHAIHCAATARVHEIHRGAHR